jgi:hypothetical protein
MKPSLRQHRAAAFAACAALLGPAGCSSSSGPGASPSSGDASVAADTGVVGEDFVPTAADFDCLQDSEWTTVGLSRFKNMNGHTTEMLAVASSPDGGVMPVGTMIQLIPYEASVKRGEGYSAASHDWEFFSLAPSADGGTTIKASGGGDSVLNFAHESCLGCHSMAAPQWDLICGDADGGNTHGCASLGIPTSDLTLLQSTDARCSAAQSSDGGTEQ